MHTGMKHTTLRIWYSGFKHPDGTIEEFNEDCGFPIRDLLSRSPQSKEDAHFTYNIMDIDKVSHKPGIPWETSKDQPFAPSTTYIGFIWDLEQRTVTLSPAKTDKYVNEIREWLDRQAHTLKHVQELMVSCYTRLPSCPRVMRTSWDSKACWEHAPKDLLCLITPTTALIKTFSGGSKN